jgi:hypothetical protein
MSEQVGPRLHLHGTPTETQLLCHCCVSQLCAVQMHYTCSSVVVYTAHRIWPKTDVPFSGGVRRKHGRSHAERTDPAPRAGQHARDREKGIRGCKGFT